MAQGNEWPNSLLRQNIVPAALGTVLNSSSERFHPLCYFTKEENALRDKVARLVRECVSPRIREMEKDRRIHPDVFKSFFANGLMATEIPAEYGGLGLTLTSTLLVNEEIAKVDPAVASITMLQNGLLARIIMQLGDEKQKKKYLPRLAKDQTGCFCLTETSSGSDTFAMKTTAEVDGEDFIINGSKSWIAMADVADVFIVFANADPSKGYKGITCFIVDKATPGLSVGSAEETVGLRAVQLFSVDFKNVRVHKSAVLGELFQGYKYILHFLNISRFGVAAQQLGISKGCFDLTIPYLLERKQFGTSLIDFQGLQHQIARIAVKLEAAKLLVYNGARLVENGLPFGRESSIAKYYASELSHKVTKECIDWMGGVGLTTNYLQEKFYRDCKCGNIVEGTSNILLNSIAKTIKDEFKCSTRQ